MKKILTWAEVAFTLLSLVLYTGGPIFLLLSQGYSEGEGTGLAQSPVFDFSLARNLFLLNYICTAGLLALRWKQALYVLCQERVLLLLVLFAGSSVLWSIDPATTQSRGIALIGTTLFGFYLASRYSLRQQCYLLANAFGIVIATSLLFIVALPQYGIMGGTHTGAWRGIYTHKNQLGKMMALAVGLLALLLKDARSLLMKGIILCGLGLGVLLLLMSRSTTALIIIILILPLIPTWRLLRLRARALAPTLMLATCLFAFGVMIFVWNADSVLTWFQKDLTLSGRTQLWPALSDVIARRPWLGYGFNGFWEGGWGSPVGEVWRAVRWRPPSAHNSWLDVWIEVGAVGLALMALSFLLLFTKATRWARVSRSFSGFWPITFLCCLFINSLTETSLLTENDILWVLYSALAFTLSAQKIRIPCSQLLSSPKRSHLNHVPIGAMAGSESASRLFSDNPFNITSFGLNSSHTAPLSTGEPSSDTSTISQNSASEDSLRTRAAQFTMKRLAAGYAVNLETVTPEQARKSSQKGSLAQERIEGQGETSPDASSQAFYQEHQLFSDSDSAALIRTGRNHQEYPPRFQALGLLFRKVSSSGRRLWKRLIRLNLFRSAVVALLARVLRVAVQASYFIFLTRFLSIQEYGIFSSISATVGLVVPFATLGTEHLIVRDLSRDKSGFSTFFGNALVVSSGASTLLIILVASFVRLLFPETVSLDFVILIALADLFFFKVIEISQNVFLTLDWSILAAFLSVLKSLKNLVAILVFSVFFVEQNLNEWAFCYCASTFFGAIIAFSACTLTLGRPQYSVQKSRKNWKEGLYFSIGIAAHNVNSNIDKTMLLKWSTAGEAGIYSAAYRIISIALTPMFSLMAVSYSKFFSNGESGLRGSLGFASKILPFAASYGILSALLVALGAPLVVPLFGIEYSNCIDAIRWLSPLLIIHSVKFLMEDSLAGAGLQRTRSLLQIGAACFNILLNLYLLPTYSWRGAAWSSLASESLLIVALLYFINRYYRLEQDTNREQYLTK